jgi:krueppel-like family protein
MHHKCGSSISDEKSHQSDDESLEYKLLTNFKQETDAPLNLTSTDGRLMSNFMKKFNESRMLQLPQIKFIQTELPEQTEPEDLSMHSPKSPVSMDELEELDDAATLYLKLQHKKLKKEV